MKEQGVHIRREGSFYFLEAKQWVDKDVWEMWEFFSVPENLPKLTPEYMNFEIVSGANTRAYSGQIISYKVNILPLIRVQWVTELKDVEPPHFFVDEQRHGPYSMWHHEHRLIPHEDGTIIYDKVTFKLPMGFLHRIIYPLVIKSKLKSIFTYRQEAIQKMFSSKTVLRSI